MDWNVDGHFISAPTADQAVREAATLYHYSPESVRPWTSVDQEWLDWLTREQ